MCSIKGTARLLEEHRTDSDLRHTLPARDKLASASRPPHPIAVGFTLCDIMATAKRIHRRKDVRPQAGIETYGDTLFADPVNNKYPIDTPGRIRAAWAYIHQPSNRAKYTAAERRTIMSRIKRAAKARRLTLPDPEEFVELMARLRKAKRRT
jgi:hypothetical protein